MSPLQKAGQLLNSWDIAIAAGESTSRIRVQNLQATLKIGIDAWGRSGKLQPVLISASISLQEDFETAATGDNVDHSTIHYGILSKEILKLAELIGEDHSLGEGITLGKFYMEVLRHLTDFKSTYNSKKGEKPVIDTTMVRALGIEIMLPKASLLGSGVSFYGTELFGADVQNHAYCMRLKFHDLRIATLIGVNANERLAKQMVVANVEIDRWVAEADRYVQIEQLIVMVSHPSPRSDQIVHEGTDNRRVLLPDFRSACEVPWPTSRQVCILKHYSYPQCLGVQRKLH